MTRSLTEQFNIIKKFIKCHAGEGDHVQARQAAETITPAAEQGDGTAQFLLGRIFHGAIIATATTGKRFIGMRKPRMTAIPKRLNK